MLLRLWQAGSGLVTTLLAVHFLTPELQGWYYSFLSVAALSTLFDLGLSTVLVQISAHLFIGLRWINGDMLEGAHSQHFNSLINQAARWYAITALLFTMLLLPGGWIFFSLKAPPTGLFWAAPWIALCCCTALGLFMMPFLAVLEGSGQISQVYAMRLVLSICGTLACWALLANGARLWATIMVPAMAFCVPLIWLVYRRRHLFAIAYGKPDKSYQWWDEVWPLQWRLAANWLCGYLLTQINIPLLFQMQGPVVAGQFGLSLAVVNTIGIIAQSWLLRHAPAMAQAAGQHDWQQLDRLFWHDFGSATAVYLIGTTLVLSLGHYTAHTPFMHRLLPWPQLFGLFLFTFASQLIAGFAAHLRSFRREPLVGLIVVSTMITIPAALYAARSHGSAGLIAVLASINCAVNLPITVFLWRYRNRQWRTQ